MSSREVMSTYVLNLYERQNWDSVLMVAYLLVSSWLLEHTKCIALQSDLFTIRQYLGW